jgi:hypothetical protein
MPSPLSEIAFYAALCSDVYHHNEEDQWIDLTDIRDTLTPGSSDAIRSQLVAAGFTAASDGFYY